ncbi:hypothetical protein [Winogradskyella sp. 4-2091]|uniref:hypothetical protein n=1 Tax=Winogradskyella sp. 4-2091 TaxID=3381659 RepID=UPI0038918E27
MSSYDRINNAITELPPKSAFNVFNFINELFENRLDRELFKQKFWSFNAGEQHYICLYLKYYFNGSKRYTFFNKWLQQKEFQHTQAGEEQLFHAFKEELYKNKQQLVAILISYEKTAHRRLNQLKKYKVAFDEYGDFFNEGIINYRLPLYFKHNKLKEYFLKAMQEVMTQQQAEALFVNSFDFGNNLYPIKLLYIELENLTYIKEQISLVKKEYDDYYKYHSEKRILDHNNSFDNLTPEKQQWYSKLKDEKPTNVEFVKIMYNAFPEIRDTASKHKKGLDNFLKSYGSNLVIRK